MTDVQFEFSCTLLPGTYFLNAGLMGRINDSDTYLDRCVDALMFRVQPEPDLRPTGIIDFQIKAEISNNLIYL
jgi:lipopolysaccharide transport system ATP-binding protein